MPSVSDDDKALASNNLALTLYELGNVAQADSYFRQAAKLEKGSSAISPLAVETLSSLAVVEENTGRLPDAKRDQTEALRIALCVLPHGDPMIATIWNNLGNIAAAQRRYPEAKALYRNAEAIWIETGRANSGYGATLSNMASAEAAQGHLKQARALFYQALQADQATLGSNHPRVASDLSHLAAHTC